MSKTGVKMKVNEREQQIIHLLGERSFISVQELAERLYTSPSSIRRDLTRLESLGVVRRSYGGAVAIGGTTTSMPLVVRSEINKAAKRQIAKRASILLHDGISVILDESTTAAAMVEQLAELRDVTLFTNSMETASAAVERRLNTYLLGGALPANSATVTVGAFTLEMLRLVHADLCFFSVAALTEEGEAFDSTEQHAMVKREMLRRASTRVLLCDSSKHGRTSLYRVCSLDEVNYLASDQPLPPDFPIGKVKLL